jgi:NapC/NirT cytochrome c family, N-terminal region
MKFIERVFAALRDFVFLGTRHWLSAIGVALATFSAISFLVILALELAGMPLGNYRGLISYLLLPTIFILGLVLIPIGLRLRRKREKAGLPDAFPVLDLNNARVRTVLVVFFVLTVLNLMIVSVATYKGLEVMETDAFCGTTCHKVMQPEAVAHQVTPHANVRCVDCHIGEGAGHFARAKLNGARQAVEFLSGSYSRPVPQPTPVASEICTHCHDPARFIDDQLHIRRSYDDKEKPVETVTIFRTLVGGFRDGKWRGSHAHNGMKIRYLADPKRATITEVEVTRPDGTSDKFVAKEAKAPPGAEWLEMGCTDCHSRPAHRFSQPDAVVDRALARGAIGRNLPFIKREALTVLKASYPSHDDARKAIPAALLASYAKVQPPLDADGKAKVEAAGQLLAEEWTRNNFPQMKITWGTYVDHFQHDGCYRCHDKKHVNAKGDAIAQKCSAACHDIIADHEEKPEALDVLYP